MIVYLCTNLINSKKYVGITSGTLNLRKSRHKCDAFTRNQQTKFCRALRKYGWENFSWEILTQKENFEELLNIEKEYISLFNSNKHGYNMTEGGEGVRGYKHTEEAKRKLSHPPSQETRNKLSLARKGKKYEEIFGQQKADLLKKNASDRALLFHSSNAHIKEWLASSYEERFGEKADQIKQKISESRKRNMVDGKRTDLTDKGRKGISDARKAAKGEKHPRFILVPDDKKEKIIALYTENKKITLTMANDLGYSKHVVDRVLKEAGLL